MLRVAVPVDGLTPKRLGNWLAEVAEGWPYEDVPGGTPKEFVGGVPVFAWLLNDEDWAVGAAWFLPKMLSAVGTCTNEPRCPDVLFWVAAPKPDAWPAVGVVKPAGVRPKVSAEETGLAPYPEVGGVLFVRFAKGFVGSNELGTFDCDAAVLLGAAAMVAGAGY